MRGVQGQVDSKRRRSWKGGGTLTRLAACFLVDGCGSGWGLLASWLREKQDGHAVCLAFSAPARFGSGNAWTKKTASCMQQALLRTKRGSVCSWDSIEQQSVSSPLFTYCQGLVFIPLLPWGARGALSMTSLRCGGACEEEPARGYGL